MATVSVTTWEEFLEAIAVSGDTVELPEDALWDMNVIEPLGHLEDITIACAVINGNGTRIKNLHLTGRFIITSGGTQFNDFYLTDFIGDAPYAANETKGFFDGKAYFEDSALSGILGAGYSYLIYYGAQHGTYPFFRCSVYIESTRSWFQLFDYGGNCRYCRIEIHAANSTNSTPTGATKCEYCECIFYCPNATGNFYSIYYQGCTVRGNMQSVTSDGSWYGQFGAVSVYFADMFAVAYVPQDPSGFIACTEEQLKDPEYLRSKGFPIVVSG